MASYDQVINFVVSGSSRLEKAYNTLDQISRTITKLEKTPINLGSVDKQVGIIADSYRLLLGDAKKFYDEITVGSKKAVKGTTDLYSATKELASTTAGLQQQANAFRDLAANIGFADKQQAKYFRSFVQGAELARNKGVKAQFQEFQALNELYTKGSTPFGEKFLPGTMPMGKNALQQIVSQGSKIPNTTAALETYGNELRRVLQFVEIGSDAFRTLEEAIAGVDQQLASVGLRGQKSKIFPTPSPSGPATQLGSVKEYQQRQKYADDLLASQRKLERISVSLDASAISQNDKLQIRNRLGEAFNAIQQQNFSLAQKLGAEADRYLRDAKSRQTAAEKVERQRLRVQELNAKAAEKTAAFIATAESNLAQGASPLEAWQQGLNRVEKTAGEILDLSEQLGKEFDKQLKNIPFPEKPLATRLGGGQEVRAREGYATKLEQEKNRQLREQQKVEKEIAANAQKKIDLNNVFNRQALALKTLLSDYNTLENKGVTFLEEKARLENLVAVVTQKRFDINQKNVNIIGEELKTLRAVKAFRTSEAQAAGILGGSTSKAGGKTEAEKAESRRNRLLENALSLQGNLVSIEGRGGQVAQEKLEIEAKILQLKNMQNKASQADLQIIAQQIQELRIKAKEVANTISPEQKKAPFLERRFGKERAGAITEGLVGGAFPLLFGQGVGASLGGLAGGAAGGFLGGGLGFGLSLVGTAVGSALDQSVAAAKELGNALTISKDNFSELRQQGIYFTAELENQVRLAKERGQFEKAQQLQRGAVFAQTGDIDAAAIRGAASASNELQKAWNGVTAAVGATLAAVATPFIFALTAALRIVQGIFFVFNLIPTAISKLAGLIPGVNQLGRDLEERAIKGTKEYEDQLAEINKQIAASEKLNKISAEKNDIIQGSIGASKADYDYAVKRAEAQERVKQLEKEIQEFRASAPSGTSELRLKIVAQEGQMRIKFAEEERSRLLTNVREVFDAANESNKRIAELKKQYEQEYRDILRQNAREQEDLNLAVARKAQDTRIEIQEKELEYTRRIAQERLKGIQLANQEQSLQRGIAAQLSANPREAALVNEVQTAIDEWRTGRRAVEEEYAAKQQEIQLQAQKAEIAIQRYKLDNALRISRANEESQLKINKLQEQINKQNEEASKNDFRRQQENLLNIVEYRKGVATEQYFVAQSQVNATKAAPNAFTVEQKQRIDKEFAQSLQIYTVYANLFDKIKATFNQLSNTPKLSNVGPAPKLTDTSGTATAISEEANKQIKAYEEQLNILASINGLKEKDYELAKKILDPQVTQLEQLNQIITAQEQAKTSKERYRELLMSGVDPALAQELVRVEQIRDVQLETLDILIKSLEVYKDPKLDDILKRLKEIRSGVTGKADTAITGAKEAAAPGEKIKDFIAEATAQLNDLESVAIRVSQSIGDAVGNSLANGISGLIEGTTTAKQIFADFLKSVGQILVQEGTKMIATYIAIGIAKAFAGLLGGGGNMGGQNYFNPKTGLGVAGPNFGLAKGGVFDSNGISAFAKGGMFSNSIVSSPTLFKFADGGAMRTGVMGEAGPEAIMPLRRGSDGRLGVEARGLREAMNGGSSGAPVLNMSFETTNIGGVEYVSRDQLEAAMAATRKQASADGAKRGMSMTLDKLQQSPQTRSRLGIRS